MAKLLGTPYERGKSDKIISRRPTGGTAIQEGLFVKMGAEGFVSLANAGSAAPAVGVMGQQEAIACGVVLSGLKVAVQLDDSITPSVGQIVYVSAITNKATNTDNSEANYGTNALFTGVIGTDGRSDNTSSKLTSVRWAEIVMPNGL